MSGLLTNQQLWGCTTFIDHVSDCVYGDLIRYLSLAETLISKSAWGKVIAKSGHMVKHYHADNGCFADNGFIDATNEKYQMITFYDVGSHHHNGIVETKCLHKELEIYFFMACVCGIK